MRTSLAFVAFVAGVSFSLPSQAATVGSIEGEVLVNRGDGYRPVKGTLNNVSAGTQLMVRPGGSALIRYSDSCAVRVPAGVWAVDDAPPCADGPDVIKFTGWEDQQVIWTTVVKKQVAETASMSVRVTEPGQEVRQPFTTVIRPATVNEQSAPASEGHGSPPKETSPPAEGHQTHHYLIMGGLVAAGAAGAAVLLSQGGDDDPASP